MYYLNIRYYNPEIGRFINADGLVGQTGEILSHNMYAYTSNNPVMRIDENGYSWKSFWDNVGDFFSDTFGIKVRTEDSVLTGYYLVGETRTGVGKTKNSGKPINLNITTPKKFWKFWDFSLGVSVKIKDKGIGVNIVGNPGLSYSSGNNSYAVFSSSLGRIGYKHTTYDEDGNYDFNIIEFNGPEIVAVYYGAPVIYKIGKYIIDKIPSRPPVPGS